MTEEERRLRALAQAQEDTLVSAEDEAAAAAAAELRRQITTLTTAALVLWEQQDEEQRRLGGPALLLRIRTRLVEIRVDDERLRATLLDHFRRAFGLGVRHALDQLAIRGNPAVELPAEVQSAASEAGWRAREDLARAAEKLVGIDEVAELENALASAHSAVHGIERTARWGVNRSAAAGTTLVTEIEGASRLWLAERDACVHCLAYAGEIAGHGRSFRLGLTFGKKPLRWSGFDGTSPPLHPNCRCRVMAWRGEWARGGADGVSFPEALKREARRSIARGWSLESESERTRLDAARRLLAVGAGLPKTVEEYAARAVRKGKFPRGRRFPG